ncbi:MAG: hypothetical protein K1000chlam4_00635 [Chlamydiae bacterium]|nr:hypothetical protein [Chlamydiota bacterium]
MSRFTSLLSENKVDVKEGKIEQAGSLDINFKEILSAAFTDILEKKSSLYRSMVEKGVIIDFKESFKFPKKGISGEISALINDFKEDMK